MTVTMVRVAWWQRYLVASAVLLAAIALIWTGIVLPAAFWYCAFWPILIALPAFARDQQGFRTLCFCMGTAVVGMGVLGIFFGWSVFVPAGLVLIVAGAIRVRSGGASR